MSKIKRWLFFLIFNLIVIVFVYLFLKFETEIPLIPARIDADYIEIYYGISPEDEGYCINDAAKIEKIKDILDFAHWKQVNKVEGASPLEHIKIYKDKIFWHIGIWEKLDGDIIFEINVYKNESLLSPGGNYFTINGLRYDALILQLKSLGGNWY